MQPVSSSNIKYYCQFSVILRISSLSVSICLFYVCLFYALDVHVNEIILNLLDLELSF